jgi:D-cysteine desulfhydrase
MTMNLLVCACAFDGSVLVLMLQTVVEDDPGLEGNLLVERLVGAHVSLVSKEEYVQLGSVVILFPSPLI